MPADPKADLLNQIRTIRARLDPDVLARAEVAAAEQMAQAMKPGGKGSQPPQPETEPYDKETAREAVMLFLQSRHDGGKFATKVMEAMKQPERAVKAYGKTAGVVGRKP